MKTAAVVDHNDRNNSNHRYVPILCTEDTDYAQKFEEYVTSKGIMKLLVAKKNLCFET
jgi:hypothetical protein